MGIDRGIVTVVDAPDHHVRATRTDLGEGQFHAVDGCAIAGPHLDTLPRVTFAEAQRDGGRKGAGIAAAGILRGTDNDVAHIGQHVDQTPDTLRLITIIIGNK